MAGALKRRARLSFRVSSKRAREVDRAARNRRPVECRRRCDALTVGTLVKGEAPLPGVRSPGCPATRWRRARAVPIAADAARTGNLSTEMPMTGRSELVDIACEVRRETAAAYCVFDGAREVWVPKSQVEWDEEDHTMAMPEWLAKDKGPDMTLPRVTLGSGPADPSATSPSGARWRASVGGRAESGPAATCAAPGGGASALGHDRGPGPVSRSPNVLSVRRGSRHGGASIKCRFTDASGVARFARPRL